MCERDSEFVDDEGASARERLRQIKRGGVQKGAVAPSERSRGVRVRVRVHAADHEGTV